MKNIIIAFRSLFKKGRSNGIKIISLAVSLAISSVLISKVCFDRSFDRFYPDCDRIYQIQESIHRDKDDKTLGSVSGSVAPGMQAEIPEVEKATRCTSISGNKTIIVTPDKNSYLANTVIMADSNMFDVLPVRVLIGNVKETLSRKGYAMVSRDVAEKLGSVQNAVGKTFELQSSPGESYTVGGVYENIPENTHLRYDIAISLESYYKDSRDNWEGNDRYLGYVKLRPGVNPASLAAPILEMQKRHQDLEAMKKAGVDLRYTLLPLTDIYSNINEGMKNMDFLLAVLAFVLIFTAVMNYILIVLSTLVNRTKEIAVHKCYGASGWNLFGMVMSESFVHIFISIVLGTLLILAFQSKVEELLNAKLISLFMPQTLLLILSVCVIVFFVTGLVPAYIFQHIPVAAAFRNFRESRHMWKLALLFIQFMATAFLIAFLFVIDKQYDHVVNRDLGCVYKNLLYCDLSGAKVDQINMAKNELKKLTSVDKVSTCSPMLMPQFLEGLSGNNVSLPNDERELFNIGDMYWVDENFFSVMEIPVVMGQIFAPDSSSRHMVMVSESFVEKMKSTARWEGSPIGKQVIITEHSSEKKPSTICGVFRNIKIGDAKNPDNRPNVVFYGNDEYTSVLLIKVHQMSAEDTKAITNVLTKLFPDHTLDVKELSADVADVYTETHNFRDSIMIGGIVTLLIALVGLLGYTSDETNRRGREIAIRKVNGATAKEILVMISKDITFIAVPAILIGIGAAYYLSQSWLDHFADKARMGILLFLAGALFVYIIIVVCVIWRAWMAANANPVDSLKSE